jgi:hypothetical protein
LTSKDKRRSQNSYLRSIREILRIVRYFSLTFLDSESGNNKSPSSKPRADDGLSSNDDGEEDKESSSSMDENGFKKPKSSGPKRGRRKAKWSENTQARRERNRKSAQESRRRKKNFVKCLEEKVRNLEAEVKRQRIIIESQKTMAKMTKYSQMESMSQLVSGRQMQYEKLHYLLENKSHHEDIENQIDALNIRHGSFGKERKILLNSFFKNVVDNMLPNYAKYLMHAAENVEEKDEDRVEKLKKFSKYQLTELMENDRLE